MKKKAFALLLCILICLSMFPASALAEDEPYYVWFWYTSPLTLDESGNAASLQAGDALLLDESSDYLIGQVPASILQSLRSYAQSQNLQDHCIVSWTVKETGEAFDFVNQSVDELASEDHVLNLLATWGTENGHGYGNWVTTQEATCYAPGTRVRTCYICGASESDTIPAAHSINPTPVEAVPATSTEDGTLAYYVCDGCGTKFSDPEGANELASIVDPCTGHEMTYYPETAATCMAEGNSAYYYCEKCDGCFSDENGENQIDAATVVVAVNPDAHEWENGICVREGCGAECEHENVSDGVCQICGETVIREEKKVALFAANPLQAASEGQSGKCGDQVQWALTDEGKTLTISGTGAMYNYDGTDNRPPWYEYRGKIESVVIGEGITGIGNYAFYELNALRSVSLLPGLTTIGDSAFSCTSIKSIVLPDTITSIGNEAFTGTLIEEISIPNGVTGISTGAFSTCKNLASVTIPGTVKTIGPNAFASCESLTNIVIPEGVETIGSKSFSNCTKLNEITLPKSLTTISQDAFETCNALTTVRYNGSETQWNTLKTNFDNGNNGNQNLLGAGIVFAEESASGTTNGTTNGTGSDTTATSGTIEGSDGTSLTWTLSDAGVLTISGTGMIPAFSEDNPAKWPKERIKTLIIGSGITAIGNNSFSGCTNLKYADLSAASDLTSIGEHAFDGVSDAVIVGNSIACTFADGKSNLTSAEKLSAAGTSSDNYTVLSLKQTISDENVNKILQAAASNLEAASGQTLSRELFEIVAIDSSGNRVESISGGITFTLIRQFTAPKSNYGVYHLKADGTVEKLEHSVSSGALNVTMSSFSPVALVSVQDSGSSETTPQAPTIMSYSDIFDGGATATGSITVNKPNNRKLEWIWMDSNTNPGDSAAGTELVNTNTLSNLKTSGYYFFRFKEDTAAGLPRSAWVGIEVLDYYTITLTPATAENGNFKVSGALKYNNRDNVYYAVKGSKVTVTFEPAEYYELYSLSVNNVDKDPVTGNPLVINGITAKTDLKYAFRMSVPIVSGLNHVVNNGIEVSGVSGVTGTIQFKTDGREIEYVVQSARPTDATEWKTITGAKIADIKSGGTYWYRYKGQPISKIDSVVIKDYYSVTIDGTGKGTYKVLSTDTAEKDKEKDNVYYVLKGDSIKVKFTPDKGWMLYEVDKNGVYITKAKMNELKENDNTLTIENITNATTIKYIFSDTASSPKTGDRSEVNLWIAEEIVSLLGMTAITWYLFRRKET